MCRFVACLGAEIPIRLLVTEPANSIIHQSFHSHLRAEPLNGDGFGLAWYAGHGDRRPALFRSMTPAWSNRNLAELARVTRSRCVFAHVRAATPGMTVGERDCHPFVHGELAMMHNGVVGAFHAMRRALLAELSDEAFGAIEGMTDSEHLFAVILDRLALQPERASGAERLAGAVSEAVSHIEAMRLTYGPDTTSSLNLAITDGRNLVATRWATPGRAADSLYYNTGRVYVCGEGLCHLAAQRDAPSSVLVASEPLDDDERWSAVERGHMLVIGEALDCETRALPGAP